MRKKTLVLEKINGGYKMFGYVELYVKVVGENNVYYGSYEGDFSKPIDDAFCKELLEKFKEVYLPYDKVLSIEYCTKEEYVREVVNDDIVSVSWDESKKIGIAENYVCKLSVPLGSKVYEAECPQYPYMVTGYRIGKMSGENEDDYEEYGYDDDAWHIQYANGVSESSAPVSEIGVSIFLTQKEAKLASKSN